jgi:protease I
VDTGRGGRHRGSHADLFSQSTDRHPKRGREWVDREVVVDGGLVTSRKPDDCDKVVEEFEEEKHEPN